MLLAFCRTSSAESSQHDVLRPAGEAPSENRSLLRHRGLKTEDVILRDVVKRTQPMGVSIDLPKSRGSSRGRRTLDMKYFFGHQRLYGKY